MNEPSRLLAVSLGARTMPEASAALARIAAEADIVELRLDYFEEPYDLRRLLANRPIPVVVTNRPTREGGRCRHDELERLAVLHLASELGAEYVDVEWDAASPELLDALRRNGARVVLSRHSFDEMPSDFERWYDDLIERGADVVKVVGMARDARDVQPVLRVLERATRPTIAIAMGEAGLPSRVLALRYDSCFLTYATLGSGERVAPGQLPLADMRDVYRAKALGPCTQVFGILARNADSSAAGALNRWFRESSCDAVAVPVPGAVDLGATIDAYRSLPMAGWLARDEEAMPALATLARELTPRARAAGRVNVLVNRSGRFVGESVNDLAEAFQAWTRAGLEQRR